jgi:tetratricopeptide (TPR) repeat protein
VDLKRLVALKMILAGSYAGAKEQARFRTEAEAVARLQHPNIVQIYEVGQQEGCLFLALEFVDGVSLDKMSTGRPIPARQAGQLVQTLARAIHAAHQQGIIHRDLKPGNVLLTGDGVPKITDFGLAKVLDSQSNQTSTNAFLGTPCYMAPEQAEGRTGAIGPASDVYSLGTILYELLTGRPPFVGESPMDTVMQVLHDEAVPPSRLQTKTPRDLETICLKCLHKDPARRYPSAKELADDLERFRAGEPIQARRVSATERLLKWMRRRRAVTALVLVSIAAVLSLAAGVGWHFRERHSIEQSRHNYQQFLQSRDDALFYGIYGTLFTDTDAARNRSATDAVARKALALMNVAVEGQGQPVLDSTLSDSEKSEVLTGCYELLLLLADVAAAGLPEQELAAPERAKQALALLDRAAQLRPSTPAYHLRRARLLRQVGDEDGARQEQIRAETLPTAGAFDYFLRGQERFLQGEVEQGCVDFRAALAASPDDFWAQYYLAVGQLKLRRPTEAVACLTKCAKQRPDFIWTYLLRSYAYEQLGAFDDAEEDNLKALSLDPNEDASYLLHVQRGHMRLAQGNDAEAMADLQAAVALKPDRFNAYLELARAYQLQGQSDEGDRQLKHAMRLHAPRAQLADYHAECALLFYHDKKYEEALKECDLALKLHDRYARAIDLRGRVLIQLARYEQATAAFEKYLAVVGKPEADIYRQLGLAHMKLGDFVKAADDYGHALTLQQDSELYTHRGWAYFFADEWKSAQVNFEEALRRNSENGDAYVGRGLSRVMLGKYREAVSDAEMALRRKPETPEMMHNIACIYSLAANQAEREGNATEASGYCEQAIKAVRNTLALVPPAERASFWREKIVPDKALNAIRNADAFKQLAEEFPKSPEPK